MCMHVISSWKSPTAATILMFVTLPGISDIQAMNSKKNRRQSGAISLTSEDGVLTALLGADRPVFAIPKDLIDYVVREFENAKPLREAARIEDLLRLQCSSFHCVGFYLGRPISVESLEPALAEVPPPSMQIARQQAPRIQTIVGGYVGWLLTNPEYRAEQSHFFSQWSEEIAEIGLCGVGQPVSLVEGPSATVLYGSAPENYRLAVSSFLGRWRLLRLTAPDVPIPMRPVVRGFFPAAVQQQILASGRVVHIPDTFPIPSRDELRQLLTESLRSSEDESHLAEWHRMVRARDHEKNKINSLARIRLLFHYWRAINSRHGSLLKRGNSKLQAALAAFLDVTESTIKRDIQVIKKRLGNDWAAS